MKLRQYLDKTNDVMRVLQEPKPMRISDYTVVLGMVFRRAVETCAESDSEKLQLVDAICRSIRIVCLDEKEKGV